jgi:prepilin-type processing-associated H-X9-DG protein
LLAITDGTSNTILFGERTLRDPNFNSEAFLWWQGSVDTYVTAGVWTASSYNVAGGTSTPILTGDVPINYRLLPPASYPDLDVAGADHANRMVAFGSEHPSGANFAFCDGSVRFLSNDTNPTTLQYLITYAGGEVLPSGW